MEGIEEMSYEQRLAELRKRVEEYKQKFVEEASPFKIFDVGWMKEMMVEILTLNIEYFELSTAILSDLLRELRKLEHDSENSH